MEYKTIQSTQNIQKSSLQKWVMPKVIWPTIGYVLLGANSECGGLKGLQKAPVVLDAKKTQGAAKNAPNNTTNTPQVTNNKTTAIPSTQSSAISYNGNSGNLSGDGHTISTQNSLKNTTIAPGQTILTLSQILTPEQMALVQKMPLEALKSLIEEAVSKEQLPIPFLLLPFLNEEDKKQIANLTPEQREALINELRAILASKENPENTNLQGTLNADTTQQSSKPIDNGNPPPPPPSFNQFIQHQEQSKKAKLLNSINAMAKRIWDFMSSKKIPIDHNEVQNASNMSLQEREQLVEKLGLLENIFKKWDLIKLEEQQQVATMDLEGLKNLLEKLPQKASNQNPNQQGWEAVNNQIKTATELRTNNMRKAELEQKQQKGTLTHAEQKELEEVKKTIEDLKKKLNPQK